MALEAAFDILAQQLRRLRELLQQLEVTVQQDHPERDETALVQHLGEGLIELQALTEESFAAAAKANKAVTEGPLDLNGARRALSVSHERFNRASLMLHSNFLSYEFIAELVHYGKEHGKEWSVWVQTVRQGLDRCRSQLQPVSDALLRCWQELAERAGTQSVSEQVNHIGQRITQPPSRTKD